MNSAPIIIIGAGIGGLVLAQALRKHNIPCEVYERDAGPGSREQGWALGLHWVLPQLREVLPLMKNDLSELAVNAAFPTNDGIAVLDGETGQELMRRTTEVFQELLIIDRSLLRTWLTQSLTIHWNKQYKSHTVEEGRVVVTFEDGSSIHGSALIGADGVNSRVRASLFDKPQTLENVPVSMVVGVHRIPKHEFIGFVDRGVHLMCLGNNKRMVQFMRSVSDDRETAEFIWYLTILEADPTERLKWSKSELLQRAKKDVEDLPDMFRNLVHNTTTEDELVVQLLRTLLLDDIKKGPVTLIGDAAHAMTPFRGEGGQHAILDSINLSKLIVQYFSDREKNDANGSPIDLSDLFKIYEAEMLERGRKAVQSSKEAISFMHKPLHETRAQAEMFKKMGQK